MSCCALVHLVALVCCDLNTRWIDFWLWLPVINQDFQDRSSSSRNRLVSWCPRFGLIWGTGSGKHVSRRAHLYWQALRGSAQGGRMYLPEGDSTSSTASEPPSRNFRSGSEQSWLWGLHLGYTYSPVSETTLKARLKWLMHQDLYSCRALSTYSWFLCKWIFLIVSHLPWFIF